MSDKQEVVKLEGDLSGALEQGGDAALDSALRGLMVGDDGKPEPDFDADGDEEGDGDASAAGKGTGAAASGDDGKNTSTEAADVAAATGTDAGSGNAAAAAADAGKGSQPGTGDEGEGKPIQNKQGTDTIPYEVLKGARQQAAVATSRATKAEEELAAARAELARTREQLAAGTAGAGGAASQGQAQQGSAAVTGLTAEDLADMPEPVQKLARYAQSLEAKVSHLESTTSASGAQQRTDTAEILQSHIDAVPDLAEWQAKGGVLWKAAVEKDVELSNDPAWQSRSDAERFAEVARQVRAEVGLPPRQSGTTQQTKPAGTTAQQGAAPAGSAAPASLSHIPGGAAPMLDPHDSIERTSAPGLAQRMGSMRDSDIDALLATL